VRAGRGLAYGKAGARPHRGPPCASVRLGCTVSHLGRAVPRHRTQSRGERQPTAQPFLMRSYSLGGDSLPPGSDIDRPDAEGQESGDPPAGPLHKPLPALWHPHSAAFRLV
jgi:hypothetical protein